MGLRFDSQAHAFFERMVELGANLGQSDPTATALACGSLALIVIAPRKFPRVPGAVLALLAGASAVALLDLPVETIGSRFGGIPQGLTHIAIPEFRTDLILPLLPAAFTVAVLAAIESLLSAVVADSMTGDKHNSSVELAAQGVANLLAPLVGGIPVTGAIARTATNVRAGARSPIAGIVHAFTLVAVVLLAAPLARFIPLATLAAVLFVVAYNMGEWREIGSIWRLDLAEKSVWGLTFALTVIADLTLAVQIGLGLAALLYIARVSRTTTVSIVTPGYIEQGREHILQDKDVPPYVSIVRIHGPFLVGTTDQLDEAAGDLSGLSRVVIVRLRNMTAIDATGLHALEAFHDRVLQSGRRLVLCGARDQPSRFIAQSDLAGHIGRENIQPHVQAGLARVREIYEETETARSAKVSGEPVGSSK